MALTDFELVSIILLCGLLLSVLYLAFNIQSSLKKQKQLILNLAVDDDKRSADLKQALENQSDQIAHILEIVKRTEDGVEDVKHVSDLVYKYKIPTAEAQKQIDEMEVSIGTLIDPPICGVLDPLKTVFFVLKQSDYFLLCAPRPV